MANIADGYVSIKVTGEDLIARFDQALKETNAFDYEITGKNISREVLNDGTVCYEIQFCGRWNCDSAWEFLEDFCDDSTKGKFEFEGTEFEEACGVDNKIYRNADSNWELITEAQDDDWDESEEECDEDEDD